MGTRALRIGIPAGLAALALLLGACGGSDTSSNNGDPTTAPADGNLFDGKTAAEFYSINCTGCHGSEREGIPGLGLPLLPDVLVENDAFYVDTILNGRPPTVMPPWGAQGVSEAEAEALVAFFRTAP